MSIATPSCLRRWVGDVPDGPAGVLHVAAVWERPDGAYATLRVGEGAPRSESDAVVLSGARARADAILTTGRILREEPGLVHGSIAPAAATAALETWRAELGLVSPPLIAVLSGSGELPPRHPALAAAERVLVFTGDAGAARLAAASGLPSQLEVVTAARPSASALIEHLEDACGAQSILVEAGASTAATLYAGEPGDARVDELWLSVCEAPDLSSQDIVGDFVSRQRIDTLFGEAVHSERHEDGGVPWATRVYRQVAHRTLERVTQSRPRSPS